MKSKILLTLLILFLLPTLIFAKVELVFESEKVELGETIKVENTLVFPQINFFKPLFPIPPSATNVRVSSSINESVSFERFSVDNYFGLQEYLKKVCSANEEGYIPYDEGFIINQGSHIIETQGGYCRDYKKMIPDTHEDIILINHTGLSLPLIHFIVSYEKRKDPAGNVYCDFRTYPNKKIRIVLPENAYVWESTSKIQENLIDKKSVFDINYLQINDTSLCFSYGTTSEKQSYDSKKTTLWTVFLGLLLAILLAFISLIYMYYVKGSNVHLALHITLWIVIFVTWFIFLKPIKTFFRVIPPFSAEYNSLLNWSVLGIFILYIISLMPLKLIYVKCPTCKKVIKKSGYNQHLSKSHNT